MHNNIMGNTSRSDGPIQQLRTLLRSKTLTKTGKKVFFPDFSNGFQSSSSSIEIWFSSFTDLESFLFLTPIVTTHNIFYTHREPSQSLIHQHISYCHWLSLNSIQSWKRSVDDIIPCNPLHYGKHTQQISVVSARRPPIQLPTLQCVTSDKTLLLSIMQSCKVLWYNMPVGRSITPQVTLQRSKSFQKTFQEKNKEKEQGRRNSANCIWITSRNSSV